MFEKRAEPDLIIERRMLLKSSCRLLFSIGSKPLLVRSSAGNMFSSLWKGKSQDQDTEYVEERVCKVEDMADNSMKVFEMSDGKVLLVKDKGQFYAVGPKCTHYGAPLVKGVVLDGYLRCPWHGACFSLSTGDIEDFPGIDSLSKFEVKIEDGHVKVRAKKEDLVKSIRKIGLCKQTNEKQTFAVIGGGAAGFECCETLRQKGFDGKLILITSENSAPYDRTKLSKALNTKVESLLLREKSHYEEGDIELRLNEEVHLLDVKAKKIHFKNQSIAFDKAFIASGVSPRTLNVPGSDLLNVFYIKTHDDANQVATMAQGKKVAIFGTSFIGMEVAAFLSGKASSIHVIGKSDVPFVASLGRKIGAKIKELYESKGIVFHSNTNAKSFNGSEHLESVTLTNEETIAADVCVIGIGTSPNVSFLERSELRLNDQKYVVVNAKMETNLPDIYAGGDLVQFPLKTFGGRDISIGHWQVAQAHGKIAALNMLGLDTELFSVPFFWSMMFGKGLRFAGTVTNSDDVLIDGDLDQFQFVAYYFSEDNITGVATMGKDPVASMFAELVRSGKGLKKSQIEENASNWIECYNH